ncbi:MAG: PspC family transcriptional regulator [Flavobacteriaceae bacterium]|nr:PspC family transcriptional regulator [Flavobacteriaceae bacterium]
MYSLSRVRIFFEQNGFEVCSRLADILGIKTKNVRLFFIYASFTTIIGGFLIYLIFGFWIRMKDMIYTKRSSVFDL